MARWLGCNFLLLVLLLRISLAQEGNPAADGEASVAEPLMDSEGNPLPPPPPAPILGTSQSSVPPPSNPPDAYIDAAFVRGVQDALHAANKTSLSSDYDTTPTLARSQATTPWRNRDRLRVTRTKVLADDDAQLHESAQTLQLAGDPAEQELIIHLTRHGLFRRADQKFAEFVARPTGSSDDGNGLWRSWESRGTCPSELLIADPWGSVAWEAPSGHLRTYACSWVVRPGMYRHEGYFKLSRSPIALIFRTFSLAAPHEVMDIYDGAHLGAELLGRFTGAKLPDQISSTNPEIRLVLRADRGQNSTEAWAQLHEELSRGRLRAAQAVFISAARSRLVGFYRQPMRRIIRAMAIRLSSTEEHAWMRRKWFTGGEASFDLAYNTSLTSVLQDLTDWEKRSRHEEGKGDAPWDEVYSVRRYPNAVFEPDRNPFHEGIAKHVGPGRGLEVDINPEVQLNRYLGFLDERSSGFSLDFTTSADCLGVGITPSGEGVFPPLTVSSSPIKNFDYLPFPLHASSCQPMLLSGPQITRDRPFTVADSIMKLAQENQLRDCLRPGYCDYRIVDSTGAASNCTDACDVFMQCVQDQMANRSSWKVGRNQYNKSSAAAGRQECLSLPQAAACNNIQYPNVELGRYFSVEEPKNSICLDYKCMSCAVNIFETYVACADLCGQDLENPDPECIDCSFSFEDSYEDIDQLRDKLWFGYLSGAFGFHVCPECSLDEPGMMGGPEVPLSPGCRRCHYALDDFLNSDVFDCLDSADTSGRGTSRRCFAQTRGSYNYQQDFFGILQPGVVKADLILTLDGVALAEDELEYLYGGA